MKKAFKILGIVLISPVLIYVCIYVGLKIYFGIKVSFTDEPNYHVEALNNKYDFELYTYGEDIVFPKGLIYHKMDSLNLDEISLDHDYVYLIINDLNGSVNLSEESFLDLMHLADKYTSFNFQYIGREALPMINKNVESANLTSDDLSFGYIIGSGDRVISHGFWDAAGNNLLADKPNLLGDTIVSAIDLAIKSNE